MRGDEAHQQQQEHQHWEEIGMDEFFVNVNGRAYFCLTSGEGSDFIIEGCYDQQQREVEATTDIYEAALQERTERLIDAADYLGDR